MMKVRPKVSIIVPIYNCENNGYLHQVIGDVLRQTEQSFELILCDDGSTDKTVEIAKSFLAKDNRIKLVQNRHQGVSSTRNSGLAIARGQWVTFVDADDCLLPNFLQSLLEDLNDDIDLVYGAYAIVNAGGSLIYTYSQQVYQGVEQIRSLLENTNILYRCSPWAKLFKLDIIREKNLKFDASLPHSEDRLFLYQYLMHVTCIKTTSAVGYLYANFNNNSLKHKKVAIDVINHRQRALTDWADKVIKHFQLKEGGITQIGQNLINLGIASLQSIYDEYGLARKAVRAQQKFISDYFEKSIVSILKEDQQLQQVLAKTQLLNMDAKYLWKSNLRRCIIDIKIKITARILRTNNINKHTFDSYIFQLN
jgi:glycosyltransferase involved in cell wall biosynthesis